MLRHFAFLPGVSPKNAKMAELKSCFERAGFTNIKAVLSNGNVAFERVARWKPCQNAKPKAR